MSQNGTTGLKTHYHHGDLKRALVDEALKIIREKGSESLTLREMAQRLGVTHTAPYRHFESKAQLLATVAEEGFHKLLAQLQEAADKSEGITEKLMSLGLTYVRFAVEDTAFFTVMFGADIPEKYSGQGLEVASKATLNFVREMIAHGQSEGQIVEGNPSRLAITAWSLVHGVAALLVEGHLESALQSQTSAERFTKSAIQTLLDGLKK